MLIKCLPVGLYEANCYIVTDEDTLECAVIDPGDESNTILNYLEEHHLTVKYIFLTHGHFDHTMAVLPVKEETGATVCLNKKDANAAIAGEGRFTPPEDTVWYGEGDIFHVGSLTFQVIETPGHTPGGVCLLCGEALFTGDTLFRESCGRTDLPGGDMATLLRSLKRLYDLPGDYEVYPGHMDSTTLQRERLFNYYLKYANDVGK
ncbi:MAG: MBL fold metallo-hydrolase [Oscillospiraceae bacterium]|nr:MBL fold metallo-hydrolase [Oscillospiraceae bacterium]